MPSDPAVQELQDILSDQTIAYKQLNTDPEKDLKDNLRKYSMQARSDNAPWSSNAPGIGPGLFEGLLGNGMLFNMAAQADEAPPWSIYPMMRDRYLDRLWKSETIIAGTLYSMTSRFSALPFKIEGPKRAKQRSNDLLHGFDAKRWALDLLTCDNGAFIEKIGPGRPDKPLNRNLVKALSVMDSLQCWRSFDPEYPVIYINPYTAQYHKIHYSRVITSSSMPVNRELARGVGVSAVSRAMRVVQIMRDIEIYKHEKVGGRFKRAIGMIKGKGITAGRVKDSVDDHEKQQDSIGLTRFSQILFLTVPDGDADIVIKDLAGLPDGFNAKEDTDLYVNCIALAFGIDTREIWPATQTGATKGDATVQHEKARGKGNGDIIQTAERALNWQGLPDNVTMEYDYTDDEQDLAVAQLHTVEITNVTALQAAGNLTPEQGNAVLIAKGVLDPEVLTIQGAEETEPATDDDPDSGEEDVPVETPAQAPVASGNPAQQGQQGAPKQATGSGTPKPFGAKEFNPDQPREDDGKWGDGGGSSTGSGKPDKGAIKKLDRQARNNIGDAKVYHDGLEYDTMTSDQVQSYSDKVSSSQLSSLSKAQKAAISQYTGDKYTTVTGGLRTCKGDSGCLKDKGIDKTTKDLDSAVKSSRVPEDTMLFRGMGSSSGIDKLSPGTEFVDHSFVSTSIDGHVADTFTEGSHTIARIFAPKGSSGLYMSSNSQYSEEKEVLLPRGQRYRILRTSKQGNRTYVDMEVVND